MTRPAPSAFANTLLRAVEPHVLAHFTERLQDFPLSKGDLLHEPGEPVEWVYFPESGLIGVLSETMAGESVESAMVGRDGALGVFEACGSRQSFHRAVVQIPGHARRIRASGYRELFDASSALRTAVHKYVELLLAEARQSVACAALHAVESRLSRTILEALDRSGADTVLPLTQESLAHMLGVQRTTVAVCLSALQRAGVIRSGRGSLEVLDRVGLERAACVCRDTISFMRRDIQRSDAAVCHA